MEFRAIAPPDTLSKMACLQAKILEGASLPTPMYVQTQELPAYILHDAYIFHAMIAEVPAFVLNVVTGLHLHCSSTSRAVQSVCKQ